MMQALQILMEARCLEQFKATLTIADNGKPVFADIYLSGVGYDALYVGKMVKDAPAGAIAAGNPDKLYTSAQLLSHRLSQVRTMQESCTS